MCREKAKKNRLSLLKALERTPSGAMEPGHVSGPVVGPAEQNNPVRVFQDDYAIETWGYDPRQGHRAVRDLTEDGGPLLIFVHGVLTDSVLEAAKAESLAAATGLKAYMSFENRGSRWLGWSSLSAHYDSPFTSDSAAGAREASALLLCIADAHSRTAAPPVVVAHSRGALILTRAATLWEGLTVAAVGDDRGNRDHLRMETPGFAAIWRKLDSETRRALLARREEIRDTRITAITGCPAVPRGDPRWESLMRWAQNRSWNLYTERDWFLFFVGNPGFGRIPLLGHRNIGFRLRHNTFFGSSLAHRVVANLCRHDGLLGGTVDMLLRHNLGLQKLDADAV